MRNMLIRGIRLLVALTISFSLSGCMISEWFTSRPQHRDGELASLMRPPPDRNAGYLAPGPTLANVEASYARSETATERAVRLRTENEQLMALIAERDREIVEWQRRHESKETLLNRVESELRDAVADVTKASQQLDAWHNELFKLHARTRNETEASAQAFESLSRQVEALLQEAGRNRASLKTSPPERAPADQPGNNDPESIFPLPDPIPQ